MSSRTWPLFCTFVIVVTAPRYYKREKTKVKTQYLKPSDCVDNTFWCKNKSKSLHLGSLVMRFTISIFVIVAAVIVAGLMVADAQTAGFYETSSTTDASDIGMGCVCTRIYQPLCGSDLKTYGNDCEFACAQRNDPYLCIINYSSCESKKSEKIISQNYS